MKKACLLPVFFLIACGVAVAQGTPCTAVNANTNCSSLASAALPNPAVWTSVGSGIVNPTCPALTGNSNYWVKHTASATTYAITLDFRRPSAGGGRIDDVGLQVYTATNCSTAFTLLGCYNQAGTDVYLDMPATPGTTYYIRVFDTDGAGTGSTFDYTICPRVAGDTPCSAVNIASFPFTYTGSTSSAGITNFMTGGCAGNEPGTTGSANDFFFKVTVAANSYLTMQLTGTTAANYTELSVLSATDCSGPWACVTNGSWGGGLQADNSPASSSTPCRTVYFQNAGTYYLRVDGNAGSNGPFTATVNTYTPTGGDACANATGLSSGSPVTLNNTNCAFTIGIDDPPPALYCAGSVENTNWFVFQSDGSGNPVSVVVNNVNCNTGYYSPSAGPFGGYYSASGQFGILTSNTNACGGTYSSASACQSLSTGQSYSTSLPNTSVTNYYFVWDGNGGAECSYTIAVTNVTPMPVELLSFTAKYNKSKKKVYLDWATATETNCAYFEIEKTLDGKNYTTVTRIKGAGNSTNINTYSATDTDPYPGISYYRLKQVDQNDDATYSSLVSIERNDQLQDMIVFPNPAKDNNVDIYFSSKDDAEVVMQVYDSMGKLVMSRSTISSPGANTFSVDLSEMSKGMYFVTLTSGAQVLKTKLIRD